MAGITLKTITSGQNSERFKRESLEVPTASSRNESSVRWLLVLLMFNIPFENVVILPGFGTTVRLIGLMVAGSWTALKLWERSWRSPHPLHWIVYAFVSWVAVASLWSPDAIAAISLVVTATQLGLITVIVWDLTQTTAHLERLMQAYVLGCLVVVTILGVRYLQGQITPFSKRATIPNSDENDVGLTLAMSLPISWRLATRSMQSGSHPMFFGAINFAAVPLAVLGIFLTASRGSLIAALPVVFPILVGVKDQPPAKKVGFIAALALGLAAMSRVVPPATITRLLTIGEQVENRDIGDRFIRWGWALDLWTENSLSFLFGSGTLGYKTETGTVAHSTVLGIVADYGLVGIFLFGVIFSTLLWRVMKVDLVDRMCWAGVLVVWAVGTLSLTWEFDKMTWLLVGLCLVVTADRRAEVAQ